MKIVLLFFCIVLGIILFSIVLLILSTIRLNVKKARISNIENGKKKETLEKDFSIYLELCLFGKIKLAKIKLKRELFEKAKMQANLQDLKKDMQILKDVNIIEVIKKLKIKLSSLNLEAEFGTEEVSITVFLVTFISAILGIVSKNTNHENIYYNIMPLYQFGNVINFNLNCIINVKMVHIIYVIYILLKKGMIKNERTSNRRSYDYSYE